jgi:hypothetical protein
VPAPLRQIVDKAVELKGAADLLQTLQTNRANALARVQTAQEQLTAATNELSSQMTIAQQFRDQLRDLVNQP